MVSDEFFKRLAEENKNTKHEKDIICPYCGAEQSTDFMYANVSYWGEDSKKTTDCEECDKEFWVEEIVQRSFETTTTEWAKKEDKRINNLVKDASKTKEGEGQ